MILSSRPLAPIPGIARRWTGLLALAILITLAPVAQAQKAPARPAASHDSAPSHDGITRPSFDLMFLAEPGDTLIFSRQAAEVAFEPDTVKALTEADLFDTLDFRAYIPGTPYELIGDRLSCLQTTMPLTYNKTVNGFINFFTVRRRNYTQTMLERQGYYFPLFEEALARHGLPDELKYLSIVESGLQTRAISRSGAVGLWQFMSATGRDFRLRQDRYTDDRMDPVLATDAACRYLKYLHSFFNDWELALAAYNCGPGAIRRTMQRTGGRTFWQIYDHIPRETRSYVPQFTAVVYAMNFASEHNIYPDLDSMLVREPLDTIVVRQQVNLAHMARHLDIDPVRMSLFNPSLRHAITPPVPEGAPTGFAISMPAAAAERFRRERACYLDSCLATPLSDEMTPRLLAGGAIRGKRASPARYTVVRRGQTLHSIARTEGVAVAEIMALNKLRSPKVAVGKKLLVAPARAGQPEPEMGPTGLANARPNGPVVAPAYTRMTADSSRPAAESPAQTPPATVASATPAPEAPITKALNRVAAAPKAPAVDTTTLTRVVASALEAAKALPVAPAAPTRSERLAARATLEAAKPAPAPRSAPEAVVMAKGTASRAAAPTKNPSRQPRRTHTVQAGDTLWNISQRYEGITVQDLIRLNKLKDKNLKPGQRLIVG